MCLKKQRKGAVGRLLVGIEVDMERRMLCVEGVGAQVGFNGFGTIIRNEAALTPCYSGKKAPERARDRKSVV